MTYFTFSYCVFCTYNASQLELTTFQVFRGYMWLVISLLDNAGLKHIL